MVTISSVINLLSWFGSFYLFIAFFILYMTAQIGTNDRMLKGIATLCFLLAFFSNSITFWLKSIT